MSKAFSWLPEHLNPEASALYEKDKATLESDDEVFGNPLLVDTGGFVPLKVKIQRMQEQGIIAQFQASEFDSQDYQDMYLAPDTMIRVGDELEDIQAKLALRESIRQEVLARNSAEKGDSVAKAQESSIDKQDILQDTEQTEPDVSDKTKG